MCVMPKANEVRKDCIYFRTWDGKKQEKVVKKILILHSVSGVANSDMISD